MEVEAREGGQAEADVMDDRCIGEHRDDRHGQRWISLYRWFDCRGEEREDKREEWGADGAVSLSRALILGFGLSLLFLSRFRHSEASRKRSPHCVYICSRLPVCNHEQHNIDTSLIP
jgi:hypothetical protein